MASDNLFQCADDSHRVVYQNQLERNGVTINGKLRKLIAYPEGIHHLESITNCNGGLYCFDMESSEVTNVLENVTDNCSEIKKVARFKGTPVFTDVRGRQVKWCNPSTKTVETLVGDGSEGVQDGTGKSFSPVQVHGIWSVSDTLFTTDTAAGKIKLTKGLSGLTDFLEHLGILYDTFGIIFFLLAKPLPLSQLRQLMSTSKRP